MRNPANGSVLVLIASRMRRDILCGKRPAVHEEKFDIAGVVDKEGLVAGRHHVACLSVGSVTNLQRSLSVLFLWPVRTLEPSIRTFGMTAWPLNRLRTLLSIPFGFLHDGSTRIKRSDWWRLKGARPVGSTC